MWQMVHRSPNVQRAPQEWHGNEGGSRMQECRTSVRAEGAQEWGSLPQSVAAFRRSPTSAGSCWERGEAVVADAALRGSQAKARARHADFSPSLWGGIIAETSVPACGDQRRAQEPRPLGLRGRRTVMITVSHRDGPIRMAWTLWRPRTTGRFPQPADHRR